MKELRDENFFKRPAWLNLPFDEPVVSASKEIKKEG